MKTNVIIALCLALLQTGIAQNESSVTESTPTPVPETSQTASTTETTASTTTENSVTTTERSTTIDPVPSTTWASQNKTKIVEKLSEQIRSILKHFHEPYPVGFPGQVVLADPMTAPNTTTDLGLATGHFYNLTIHGLSNFTLEAVNMFLDDMQVYVMIRMKKVLVRGNLTAETIFTTSKGPFNMTLTNVTAEGTVNLKANQNGKLYAEKSSTEMFYEKLELSTNSNSSSLMQSVMDVAGAAVLHSIKPHILGQIDKQLNEEVNKQLESSPKYPAIANTTPVDLAVIEGRRMVRKLYEPFTISNVVNHDSEYLNVNVGPVTIKGLSKFARVGNITVQMREGVVQFVARFITGRLVGDCKFYYDFGKVGITRNSTAKFSIDHLQFEAKVNQTMNLRKKPILHDFQMEVGKIYVKLDGTGDFDFLVEMAVGLIPDIIRSMVVDEIEKPIKEKLQSEVLDKINVEQLIEDNLPFMENFIIL